MNKYNSLKSKKLVGYNILLIAILFFTVVFFSGCSNVVNLGKIKSDGGISDIETDNYKVKIKIVKLILHSKKFTGDNAKKIIFYEYSVCLITKETNRLIKDAKCRVEISKLIGSIRFHTGKKRIMKEFVSSVQPGFNKDTGNYEFEYHFNSQDRYELEIAFSNISGNDSGKEITIRFMQDV